MLLLAVNASCYMNKWKSLEGHLEQTSPRTNKLFKEKCDRIQ